MEVKPPDFAAGIKNTGIRILVRVLLFIIFAVVPVLWVMQLNAKNETISDLKESKRIDAAKCDSIQKADSFTKQEYQNSESKWKDSFLHYVQGQNEKLERHLDLTQHPQ